MGLVQRRDGDLARDVLGWDDPAQRVLGDSVTTIGIEKDLFEGVEGVLLCGQSDGTFLHRHDEVFDHGRCERVHPAGFQDREDLAVEDLVDRADAARDVVTLLG
ncbi:hypothetical protein [Streptomyces sp. NBC_00989]|uniref:hypothetical protein n=1 Tax=Streptomyces sp. NBC_00989 TaxID=2903705 RepID=UPI00386DA30B|nr:hypothetical protein OG714_47165 [Streptomyces sp. NBC_00989]